MSVWHVLGRRKVCLFGTYWGTWSLSILKSAGSWAVCLRWPKSQAAMCLGPLGPCLATKKLERLTLPPNNMEPDRGSWKAIFLLKRPPDGFHVNWWPATPVYMETQAGNPKDSVKLWEKSVRSFWGCSLFHRLAPL